MVSTEPTYYVRTCQECGHKQAMKDPALQQTDNWREAKCRACKSESLDYGSPGWYKQGNQFYKLADLPEDD